jgi:predicted small lipoprotein YifL
MAVRAVAVAALTLLLAACGQKSGLYMPEDAPEEVPLTPEGLKSAAEAAAARAAPAEPGATGTAAPSAASPPAGEPVPAGEPAPREDEDTRPNN